MCSGTCTTQLLKSEACRKDLEMDFLNLKVREGIDLREAVIEAGVVRFRPMLLTAMAVIAGAGVILFDPIFQAGYQRLISSCTVKVLAPAILSLL